MKRIIVILLSLCLLVLTMPMEILAVQSQALTPLEEQRNEVLQLEEELDALLEEGEIQATSDSIDTSVDYVITVDGEEIVCGTFGFELSYVDDNYFQVNTAKLVEYEEADTAPEHYEVVIPETISHPESDYITFAVLSIEDAFMDNTSITKVVLPEMLESINGKAFKGCTSLESINLGDNLETIAYSAFENCESLALDVKDIMGLENLTKIGDNAFKNTSVYGELVVKKNIEFGDYVFSATDITKIDLSAVTDTSPYVGIVMECMQLSEVVFNPATTVIAPRLVANTGVTTVFIPKKVEKINYEAFQNCPITELVFEPRTLSTALTIGQSAFSGNKLTSFTFPYMPNNARLSLERECFAGSHMTTLIYDENTTHSNFITCKSPFAGQPLQNVTVPKLVLNEQPTRPVYIPGGLFQDSKITNTKFLEDSDVIEIGPYAFANCDELVVYTNGFKCDGLSANAFEDCDKLTTLENMEYVNQIGDRCFANCDSLKTLEFWTTGKNRDTETDGTPRNTFAWGIEFASSCDKLETIIIHGDGAIEGVPTYLTTTRWDDILPFKNTNKVEFVFDEDAITTVGDGAFAGASFIKNLDFLPNSVTTYGTYSFAYTGLEEVVIEEHITKVYEAFPFCYNLTSLTIKNDIEAWQTLLVDEEDLGLFEDDGMNACSYFHGDPLRLEGDEYVNVTLPNDWTTLPEGMFYGTKITDTKFLENMPKLKTISAYAFSNCEFMEEIIIPNTVEMLDYRCFYNSTEMYQLLQFLIV